MNVNELFELIFDDNETSRLVHKAQKLKGAVFVDLGRSKKTD